MNAVFSITQTFQLTARKVFVVAGVLESGQIDKGMFLVDLSNNIRIKISSIEMIAKNREELIGLLFTDLSEEHLRYFKELKEDDWVIIAKADI